MNPANPIRLTALALLLALSACKPAPAPSASTDAAAPAAAATESPEGHAGHGATDADTASDAGSASETRLGTLVISAATSRETPLAGGTAPGFLRIRNDGSREDRLLSASSPLVQTMEIHEMSMDGGQMQMRALPDGLPIPAGATVELAPGGLHLMLIGVQAPLAAGQRVPVELRFAEAGAVTVNLAVQARKVAH